MSKSLSASKKVMQAYLADLLDDNEAAEAQSQVITKTKSAQEQKLELLLEQVETAVKPKQPVLSRKAQPIIAEPTDLQPSERLPKISEPAPQQTEQRDSKPVEHVKADVAPEPAMSKRKEKAYREGSFQAMFFDVAGLTVAVPLIELGGIHNAESTSSLMGKPDWFKGVMIHREEKINVVDTARWVMPEKCDQKLLDSLNYQYVIMLSESAWGLLAENLVDTVTLQQDDVKWLDAPSKRPWLAGLVKDRMCALLDVEALIKLLNDGANVHQA
ncbi:chemotaxis protein CheW [Endozoicomonas sp. G2_1]|uniref:chemotaxis protein CheW n=1 Tax=Endozoicomonas sp. G2_1 TaxID=2821091 RepID=UPI001ADB03A2|nr:chemotaxis protein CheW [Endozoicomonas sp. G2_1]MBO9491756.1 chemotaxis protein CheW [Endozoicomonas sp. G2_1]